MDAAIRDKWAAKLESGRYYQAHGALRQGSAYCCLGVLCELFREETAGGEWVALDGGNFSFRAQSGGDCLMLPVDVREWAGLGDSNPLLKPDDPGGRAASLNDTGFDFNAIAALVRQLPGKVESDGLAPAPHGD